MLEYLDKLRMKPRHVRERIAFFTTAIFSLFIGSVWWGVWGAERNLDAPIAEDISPASAVVEIFGRAKSSTRELFGGLVDPVQYSASGTTATAQVGSALVSEKGNNIVYAEDVIDNTIRVSGSAATIVASTSVE